MAASQVAVLGAGVAGTAAAFAAARAGAKVFLVSDRAGATALYSGALDLVPWQVREYPEERAAAEERLLGNAELRAFADALGVFRLGRAELATREGLVRPALGSDPALLDLAPFAGARIGVLDVERDDWDAALLAKSFAASHFAERTRTTFAPVPAKLLKAGHERRIATYDLAALLDDPARVAAFAESLREVRGAADAFLSGPWLGLEPDTARALAAGAGVPLGETTSKLGGVSGARFERARDRLLAALGVERRAGRVTSVTARGERLAVALDDTEPGEGRELEVDGAVLATGGVASGGIVLTWDPEHGRRGFELAYSAPVDLALDGEHLTGFGSLHGPTFDGPGLAVLERVGIAARPAGNVVATGPDGGRLAAAGDCLAGRPRTVLQAVLDGLAAGAGVARD